MCHSAYFPLSGGVSVLPPEGPLRRKNSLRAHEGLHGAQGEGGLGEADGIATKQIKEVWTL